MFQANLLPGQGFQPFTVHTKSGGTTKTGRPIEGTYQKTDVTIYGMLTRAKQDEIEKWKQEGHPITHTITEFSAMKKANTGNLLVKVDGREFYVQGVKNPGDLNVTMIYYVEERFDIKRID